MAKPAPISAAPKLQSGKVVEELPGSSRVSLRCILAAVAIIIFPLMALPWALETHEFYKQILLGLIVAVGLIFVLDLLFYLV